MVKPWNLKAIEENAEEDGNSINAGASSEDTIDEVDSPGGASAIAIPKGQSKTKSQSKIQVDGSKVFQFSGRSPKEKDRALPAHSYSSFDSSNSIAGADSVGAESQLRLTNERIEEQGRMRSRSNDFTRNTISLIELVVQSPEDALCSQDKDGDNELMISIIKQYDKYAIFIIDTLVSRKQQKLLDIRNSLGQSALHLAVIVDLPSVTKALVKAGSSIELRDKNGRTPLHCASDKGLVKHMAVLTSKKDKSYHKIVAESYDYQGWNCLHLAAMKNSIDVVEYLVKSVKVNVNQPGGSRGITALHFAVMVEDIPMIIFLVRVCKADVNAQTYDKWTPLEFAIGFGRDSIINTLIRAGASVGEYYDMKSKSEMGDSASSFSDDEMEF